MGEKKKKPIREKKGFFQLFGRKKVQRGLKGKRRLGVGGGGGFFLKIYTTNNAHKREKWGEPIIGNWKPLL